MNTADNLQAYSDKTVVHTLPQEEYMTTSAKEIIVVTGSSGLIEKTVIDKLHPAYQIIGLDKEG